MLFKNQEKQEKLLKNQRKKKPKGACRKEMWQQEVYYNWILSSKSEIKKPRLF